MSERRALVPPDPKRCQAEKSNGPFRMGGPAFTRCGSKPILIVREKKVGKDGRRGSMSLCLECYSQLVKQLGADHVTTRSVKS
jgi:hypothetical protein